MKALINTFLAITNGILMVATMAHGILVYNIKINDFLYICIFVMTLGSLW